MPWTTTAQWTDHSDPMREEDISGLVKTALSRLVPGKKMDVLDCEAAWSRIVHCYSRPHRKYHTMAHLTDVVSRIRPHLGAASDPDLLVIAAAYHDIVYTPGNLDNEAKSAGLLEEDLRGIGVSELRIERAKRHILVTSAGFTSADPDSALLRDADWAVLGLPSEEYDSYVRLLREEHREFTDVQWLGGRVKFLADVLSSDRIFHSDAFSSLEEAARSNCSREMSDMGVATPPWPRFRGQIEAAVGHVHLVGQFLEHHREGVRNARWTLCVRTSSPISDAAISHLSWVEEASTSGCDLHIKAKRDGGEFVLPGPPTVPGVLPPKEVREEMYSEWRRRVGEIGRIESDLIRRIAHTSDLQGRLTNRVSAIAHSVDGMREMLMKVTDLRHKFHKAEEELARMAIRDDSNQKSDGGKG